MANRDVSRVIPGNPNCNELTILFLPEPVAFTMNTDTAIVEQLSQIFQTEVYRGL
jgi:hypothetical protein